MQSIEIKALKLMRLMDSPQYPIRTGMRGAIRFRGGTRHNQHLDLKWDTFIPVFTRYELDHGTVVYVEHYELWSLQSIDGATFYEYQLSFPKIDRSRDPNFPDCLLDG